MRTNSPLAVASLVSRGNQTAFIGQKPPSSTLDFKKRNTFKMGFDALITTVNWRAADSDNWHSSGGLLGCASVHVCTPVTEIDTRKCFCDRTRNLTPWRLVTVQPTSATVAPPYNWSTSHSSWAAQPRELHARRSFQCQLAAL